MRDLYNKVLSVELSTSRPKQEVMRDLGDAAVGFGLAHVRRSRPM